MALLSKAQADAHTKEQEPHLGAKVLALAGFVLAVAPAFLLLTAMRTLYRSKKEVPSNRESQQLGTLTAHVGVIGSTVTMAERAKATQTAERIASSILTESDGRGTLSACSTGYETQDAPTATLETATASRQSAGQPMAAPMMLVPCEGVLLLDRCEPSEEWLDLFRRHRAKHVYFDLVGRSIEEVFDEAVRARDLVKSIRAIPNPVVVGPVKPEHYEFLESRVGSRIRTTVLDYKSFCKDLRDHRPDRVESLRERANDDHLRR